MVDFEKISLDDVRNMGDKEFRQFVFLCLKDTNCQLRALTKELKWNRWLMIMVILTLLAGLLRS